MQAEWIISEALTSIPAVFKYHFLNIDLSQTAWTHNVQTILSPAFPEIRVRVGHRVIDLSNNVPAEVDACFPKLH